MRGEWKGRDTDCPLAAVADSILVPKLESRVSVTVSPGKGEFKCVWNLGLCGRARYSQQVPLKWEREGSAVTYRGDSVVLVAIEMEEKA